MEFSGSDATFLLYLINIKSFRSLQNKHCFGFVAIVNVILMLQENGA